LKEHCIKVFFFYASSQKRAHKTRYVNMKPFKIMK